MGAAGIQVCDRWRMSFEAFIADMGERPSLEHSIDRIDVNGHYEPSNCRWATRAEQLRNTRRNHLVVYGGETMPLVDAIAKSGLSKATVKYRMRIGLPEDQWFLPVQSHRRRSSIA